MPRGVMKWFNAGEGRVVATSGREYPAYEADVEPRARVTGARVQFDAKRIDGVPTAVRVRARAGGRTSRRQRRFGDLTGAGRPEEKGRASLTRQHSGLDPLESRRPKALVARWIAAAGRGRIEVVLPLYAPHAVLHAPEGDYRGRGAVRGFLLDSTVLTRGWDPTPHGEGVLFVVVRGPSAADAGRTTRFRVEHGQIIEQWVDEPAGPS
jgi:hypothetical protein